jgi:hypothetical protein
VEEAVEEAVEDVSSEGGNFETISEREGNLTPSVAGPGCEAAGPSTKVAIKDEQLPHPGVRWE